MEFDQDYPDRMVDVLPPKITERFNLGPVFDLALGGIIHAVDSEVLFKKARKARYLGLNSYAYQRAAEAIHRQSRDQINGAINALKTTRSENSLEFRKLERLSGQKYKRFMNQEVLPAVRLELLEDDLTPTEAKMIYDEFVYGAKNVTSFRGELNQLANKLNQLAKSRAKKNRGVEPDQKERGVPKWKKIAVGVAVVLIRIAIRICKWYFFILCLFFSLIWRLIEKKVIKYAYKKCRDQKVEA